MQQFKIIILIILALSLALQGLNIGAMVYGVTVFQSIDAATPSSPTYMQQYSGYIVYILLASAVSALIYIFLLVMKLLNKPQSSLEWILYLIVLIFQFGVGMLYSVLLKNNSVSFDTIEANYNQYIAMGISPSLLITSVQLMTFRKLAIAAAILCFLINFLGTGFIFVKYSQDAKIASHEVGTEIKKQTSITELH